jgi:NitT/TauT family transport system permease protein
MIRKSISYREGIIWMSSALLLLILFYGWLAYRQKAINPLDTTIPDYSQITEAISLLCQPDLKGEYWVIEDLKATYYRHILGMAVGVSLALILGLGMASSNRFHMALNFPLTCLAKVPPTAMMAVYFVLFGTDLEMFVAMISFGIMPTLAQTVNQSARHDVPEDAIYKAYTLGASNSEVVCSIIFPQILPRLIEGIRLMIGPALVFLIAAEWTNASIGVGYRLRIQSRLLNMNVVYIYLLLLCLTSFLMDWSLRLASRKLCPWDQEK